MGGILLEMFAVCSIQGNELPGLGAFPRGLIFVHALNCGSKEQEGAAHQEQLITRQGTTPLGTCWVLLQEGFVTSPSSSGAGRDVPGANASSWGRATAGTGGEKVFMALC